MTPAPALELITLTREQYRADIREAVSEAVSLVRADVQRLEARLGGDRLTKDEAAGLARASVATLERWMRTGIRHPKRPGGRLKLPFTKQGQRVTIRRADLETFLSEFTSKPVSR
jgi:hypothetical protein